MGSVLDRLAPPPPPAPRPTTPPDAATLPPLQLPPSVNAAADGPAQQPSANERERAKAATDGEAASVKEAAAEEAAEAAVNALRMRSSKRTRSYNPAQAVEKRPRIESA